MLLPSTPVQFPIRPDFEVFADTRFSKGNICGLGLDAYDEVGKVRAQTVVQ